MKYQWKIGFIIPAAIALLLTAACGGGGGGNASTGISISFAQQRYRIMAGESVTLTVNARNTEIGWPSSSEVAGNFTLSGNNRAVYTPSAPPFPQIEHTYEFTVTAMADPGTKRTAWITVYLDSAYYGINQYKEIVGEFRDAAGGVTAFLQYGNTFEPVVSNVTGNTYALGINNYGDILGFHAAADSYFVRIEKGLYYLEDYDRPYSTYYMGLNDYNEFAGYVINNSFAYGFIKTDDRFFFVDHPLAASNACNYIKPNPCGTFLTGINNYGEAVGYYYDSFGVARGFLYYNGGYFRIDPDGRLNNMTDTYVWGINYYGEAAGYFLDYDGYALGFVFDVDTWDVEIIDYPKAADPGYGTFVYGINDDSWVVGEYDDGEKFQGFMY